MKRLFKIVIVLAAVVFAFGPVGTVTSEAKINTNRVICKKDGCGNTAYSDGYCTVHSPSYDSNKCAKPGCNNKKYCGSYCATHDSCKIKSACKTANYGGRKICKNSSCGNTAGSDGYCSRHSSSSNKTKSSASTTKSSTSSKSSTTSKKNTTSNKKSNSKTDSYDKGYEDYWLNGDYDDDRYRSDWNYQLGVDDAMDEFE